MPPERPLRSTASLGAVVVTLVLTAGCLLYACSEAPSEPLEAAAVSPARPNVVVVLFDDLGTEGFGAYASAENPTAVRSPSVDRLADQGLRFTQFYAAAPVCSPSRVAFLTGLYPQRAGIRKQLARFGSLRGIPPEWTTLPEALRTAGYRTGHFGKWHVGRNRPEHLPAAQGFDVSVRLDTLRYLDPEIVRQDGIREQVQGHSTRFLFDEALRFIEESPNEPFLVYLWLWAPHTPLQAPNDSWRGFAGYDEYLRSGGLNAIDAGYAALISHADEQIGRLDSRLEDLGLTDSTILAVVTDNGGMFRGSIDTNAPFRGVKGEAFEGGSRVPLIVRWPAGAGSPRVDDRIVSTYDLVASIGRAAGLDPWTEKLDGLPTLFRTPEDGEPGDWALVWETTPCNRLPEEYLDAHPEGLWNDYAVRRESWKLVHRAVTDSAPGARDRCTTGTPGEPELLLFDLADDPTESRDLADRRPDRVRELTETYLAWRREVTAIPLRSASSPAEALPATLELEGARAIEIAGDPRLDPHDGDLSLFFRVRPSQPANGSVVARRPGSWQLGLDDAGRPFLEVLGGEGERTRLVGDVPANPKDFHLGFTVFGWQHAPATVRLWVDGTDVGEPTGRIRTVRSSHAPLVLGPRGADGANVFHGRLSSAHGFSAALTRPEVLTLLQTSETGG